MLTARRGKSGRPKTFGAIRANAGLTALYRHRLEKLIAQMDADLRRELIATWRRKPPELAADASPAITLRDAMRRLTRKWSANFDALAPELAAFFAKDAAERTQGQLKTILRRHGFTVDFTMTPEINDVLQATIAANVSLIRSIAARHLTAVEGAVMRSVSEGRDLATLSAELERAHGVTRRRAAFIARDQNNKATAAITKTRQDQLGITEAFWMHSHGGKHPRPTHQANDGKRYNVKEGWPDPALGGRRIWPGTEPGCRCFSRSIIPGLI